MSKPSKSRKVYVPATATGAASKFGQMIGEAFAKAVVEVISGYLETKHPGFILLEPDEGKQLVKLEMFGGTSRQMDNVIVPKDSVDPVALFETKWLKDGRHHNDKGAWILQLREIRRKHPSVRGAVANLAGFWTEKIGVMFEKEGRIKMVLVATDEEVYSTLQPFIDSYLTINMLEPLKLDVRVVRDSLPRSWDLANCMQELEETGQLAEIARSWFNFERIVNEDGASFTGSYLVTQAIDELLRPLPPNPNVESLEIALQIDTGNTIYAEFKDAEEAMHFIQEYFANPEAILKRITPQKKP